MGYGEKKNFYTPYYIVGTIDYHFNPNALKQYDVERFNDSEKIKQEFIDKGFKVIDYDIDKADFTQWLLEINFPEAYSRAYGEAFTEKALEHYLSSKLLDLNESDIYVDVAAAGSPYYDLAEKQYECRSFAVDLHMPSNKNDLRLIECDATDTPFEDESVSKMALHCAYEMFENDADISLIEEANRILTWGGKLIIIPLYMAHLYYILSGTNSNRRGIDYGKAKRVWWSDSQHTGNRFSRFYSVDALLERAVNHKDKLNLEIYYFTNEKEMTQNPGDEVYVKFAACFTKEEQYDTG